MQRKILVAVDGSQHSKRSLEYVARMRHVISDIAVTLFLVQPGISDFMVQEAKKDASARKTLDKIRSRNRGKAEQILEEEKNRLVSMGISADRVVTLTREKGRGSAKDTIETAETDRFDAVVAGRRGLSKIGEMVMGSFTSNLVEHSPLIPVWVVDGTVTDTRLLVSVDASDSALRAVAHLCYMVGECEAAHITLLHVTPTLRDFCVIDASRDKEDEEILDLLNRTDQKCVDRFFHQAARKFRESGIAEDRVEFKTEKSLVSVGGTVVAAAKEGGYGTLVVGRRGAGQSFFMGSVSKYVTAKAANMTVWVVP